MTYVTNAHRFLHKSEYSVDIEIAKPYVYSKKMRKLVTGYKCSSTIQKSYCITKDHIMYKCNISSTFI